MGMFCKNTFVWIFFLFASFYTPEEAFFVELNMFVFELDAWNV